MRIAARSHSLPIGHSSRMTHTVAHTAGAPLSTAGVTPIRATVVAHPRNRGRIASAWRALDRMSDLQAAVSLTFVLLALVTLSVGVLRLALSYPSEPRAEPQAPAPEIAQAAVPSAAPTRIATPVPTPARVVRTHTAPVLVNLRAAPGSAASLITTLPPSAGLQLVGETAQQQGALWQRVRTDDGREGWVIASALE